MITYVNGDLFTSPAKVLVNTVNTVGVMGKGIAKTFKQVYPDMFQRYQSLCEEGKLTIGTLWLYRTNHKWVLNFPTKKHWRNPSRPEYIEAGLRKFVANYSAQGITSVAFPRLGCGNGELDWERTVQPLMRKHLDSLPIDVFVHHVSAGEDAPEHKNLVQMHEWLRSEPRALAFDEIWEDLTARIGTGVRLSAWDHSADFVLSTVTEGLRVSVVRTTAQPLVAEYASQGSPAASALRVLGPGDLEIPKRAMLELWQNVRAFGFCVPRMMPAGLDAVGSCVMSILALLPYMRPVSMSTGSASTDRIPEKGLQLFPAASAVALDGYSPPSFSVQPA